MLFAGNLVYALRKPNLFCSRLGPAAASTIYLRNIERGKIYTFTEYADSIWMNARCDLRRHEACLSTRGKLTPGEAAVGHFGIYSFQKSIATSEMHKQLAYLSRPSLPISRHGVSLAPGWPRTPKKEAYATSHRRRPTPCKLDPFLKAVVTLKSP
jgi:hypothetical protein